MGIRQVPILPVSVVIIVVGDCHERVSVWWRSKAPWLRSDTRSEIAIARFTGLCYFSQPLEWGSL